MIPLWFYVTIRDPARMSIGMWLNDDRFPTVPPIFSYPNDDPRSPFSIEVNSSTGYEEWALETEININQAITKAIREYVDRQRNK